MEAFLNNTDTAHEVIRNASMTSVLSAHSRSEHPVRETRNHRMLAKGCWNYSI